MYERKRKYPSENRKLVEKRCKDCGNLLSISEFDWNGHGDWLPRCRKCHQAHSRKYYAKRREFLKVIKEGYGCQCGCGEDVAEALVFHHRDPSKKVRALSSMSSAPVALLLIEIAKCDVLCRNCHAKAHAGVIQFPSRKSDTDAV